MAVILLAGVLPPLPAPGCMDAASAITDLSIPVTNQSVSYSYVYPIPAAVAGLQVAASYGVAASVVRKEHTRYFSYRRTYKFGRGW
jgi:hypothetical protein